MVNGATNHALDYDYPGALNSAAVWNEVEDVIYTGIYESQADRDEIRTIERRRHVRFATYTYGTNGIEPDTSYRVAYFDEEQIRQDVANAKSVSDAVIVSAHWGDENTQGSQRDATYLCTIVCRSGGRCRHRHPPTRLLQPIEWVTGVNQNKTLVVYSLGNFYCPLVDGL